MKSVKLQFAGRISFYSLRSKIAFRFLLASKRKRGVGQSPTLARQRVTRRGSAATWREAPYNAYKSAKGVRGKTRVFPRSMTAKQSLTNSPINYNLSFFLLYHESPDLSPPKSPNPHYYVKQLTARESLTQITYWTRTNYPHKSRLIFVKSDNEFESLNFSNYYKKISPKIQLFTFYRRITERLQNGYKPDLCRFNKNADFVLFDINEEMRYNTNR